MEFEDINPELIKYLLILHRSSEVFQKDVEILREKYQPHNDKFVMKKGYNDNLSRDLTPLLKKFFIPDKEAHRIYISGYILDNVIVPNRCKSHIETLATAEKPKFYQINQPSLILCITRMITEKEWRGMWQGVKKTIEHHDHLFPTQSLAPSIKRKVHLSKTYSHIDEQLIIYRLHQKGLSHRQVSEKLDELRQEKNSHVSRRYDRDGVKKAINNIEALLAKL